MFSRKRMSMLFVFWLYVGLFMLANFVMHKAFEFEASEIVLLLPYLAIASLDLIGIPFMVNPEPARCFVVCEPTLMGMVLLFVLISMLFLFAMKVFGWGKSSPALKV